MQILLKVLALGVAALFLGGAVTVFSASNAGPVPRPKPSVAGAPVYFSGQQVVGW